MNRWIKAMLVLVLMSSTCRVWAKTEEKGPELKFNSDEKTESKFGDKPLAKFGDDNNYFKLGGYGSFRFEHDSGENLKDTFTFRRFVLTTDAKIASRFRIYSELEFERFRNIELEKKTTAPAEGGLSVSEAIEGSSDSEISLEQAWFEVDFTNAFRFRGGAILLPIGRFNTNHDDNQGNLPRRTLVDRGSPVLPVAGAWDELGLGFNGDIEIGEKSKIAYQAYVVNGAVLDPNLEKTIFSRTADTSKTEFEGEFGINGGSFSQDIKDAKALTGRLMYSPSLGHEFGISGYWGRYTPDYLVGKNLTVFAFDTLQTFGNFDFEAQYMYTRFGGLRSVMDSLAARVQNSEVEIETAVPAPGIETEVAFKPSRLSASKQGYWAEFRYHFRPEWLTSSWVGKHFSDPQLIPVLRWEQVFTNDRLADVTFSDGLVATYTTEDRRVDRLTAGLAFRLTPQAVFQLAYEYTQTDKGGYLADVTNYLETPSSKNHSVMFGAAFGF